MNAKKIMGAVLVALLAVTAFAGAAAAEETGLGTFFLFGDSGLTASDKVGPYQCGESSIVIDAAGMITTDSLEKFVNGGKYSNGQYYIYVVLPNAVITGLGDASTTPYNAMVNGLISGDEIKFTAVPEQSTYTVDAWIVYDQDKNPTRYDVGSSYSDVTVTANDLTLSGAAAPDVKGTWGIQAVLSGSFVSGTDVAFTYGKIYEFAVLGATPEITASADTVIVNNNIIVTITGAPNGQYFLDADGFTIASNQVTPGAINEADAAVTEAGQAVVTLSNGGKLNVYLTAGPDDAKKTIVLKEFAAGAIGDKLSSVSVKIVEGTITGESAKDAYYYGNNIVLSGTTTAGTTLNYFIEGQNFAFQQIVDKDLNPIKEEEEVENGKWYVEFPSGAIVDARNLKSGLVPGNTYTIVVTTNPVAGDIGTDMKQKVMTGAYATIAVTIAQPFITDIEAAATAIQGEKYTITGTAIAANDVILYVFGTSYFAVKKVSTDEEEFKFTLTESDTKKMGQGTYFYLIQHPMNDGLFNVWNGTGKAGYTALTVADADDSEFYYAATGAVNETYIFDAWTRGTSYAAQGLLEKIAGQDIDDIFVQGTFEVKPQELEINPIPATVTKGEKLVVSGTSNSAKGAEIIINVRAGTFGATIKGDGTEGVFLTERAITKEDGTWEAAIDTSKLTLGEYEVAVLLNGNEYDNADVEIVAAADKPDTPDTPVTPEQPEQPEQPTEPETPGFGALAALAGLGAVAVLLLRRMQLLNIF